MTQPSKREDMRQSMPKTADTIARLRLDMGREHVDECIRRGMAGERNCFFASEAGRAVGTPFTGPVNEDVAWYMVTFGVVAMCFIKPLPEASHGAN